MTEQEKAKAEHLAMVKAVYGESVAEINGRSYKMTKVTHIKRKEIFAFYTKLTTEMQSGDLSFVASSGFANIENIINNIVTFDGSLLSKLPNHWDTYPEDYIVFVITMLEVLSYPFLLGIGGS